MSLQGRYRWQFAAASLCFILLTLTLPSPVSACGWWGDGEATTNDDAIEIDAQGNPILLKRQQGLGPLLPSPMKVPRAMGYGIAIKSPDQAVPYLDATGGLAANSIGQLAGLGYAAVIDLGTPPSVAALHRAETENLRMRYFNIPGGDKVLTEKDVTRFAAIVTDNANLPLLVFGRSKQTLGRLWARFRLAQGADEGTANQEGRLLGLPENEKISAPALQ